jgi:transcriptional regulator of acetoin/glycerol metabolism
MGSMTLAEMEKRAILASVKKHKGDVFAAAKELGIGKTTVYRKLIEYGRARRRR